MHFQAQIKRGSTIDRMWRAHNRLGGEVSGVLFSTTNISTAAYISTQTLHASAVTAMLDNPNVELIATGIPLPMAPAAAQGADSLGKDDSSADLKTKLMAAPIAPGQGTDPDAEPGEETVTTEPAAQESVAKENVEEVKENVAEEGSSETNEPSAQEDVVEEQKTETSKPKNTGSRRNR